MSHTNAHQSRELATFATQGSDTAANSEFLLGVTKPSSNYHANLHLIGCQLHCQHIAKFKTPGKAQLYHLRTWLLPLTSVMADRNNENLANIQSKPFTKASLLLREHETCEASTRRTCFDEPERTREDQTGRTPPSDLASTRTGWRTSPVARPTIYAQSST